MTQTLSSRKSAAQARSVRSAPRAPGAWRQLTRTRRLCGAGAAGLLVAAVAIWGGVFAGHGGGAPFVHRVLAAPAVATPGGSAPGSGGFNGTSCGQALCVAIGADASGFGVLATSNDGGVTWDAHPLPAGAPELDAAVCPTPERCVAVGRGGAVSTADGGRTWQLSSLPVSNATLLGVVCPGPTSCVSTGVVPRSGGPESGVVMTTSDGGGSWSVATGVPEGLGSTACPTATTCVAVGDTVLVTHDGGAHWSSRPVIGGTGSLRSISCSSATVCVAVGPNGKGVVDHAAPGDAIRTTDGGLTWTQVPLPQGTSGLWQVACAGSRCLAAGAGATPGSPAVVVSSADGGANWALAPVPGGFTAISGLSCAAPTQCLAVGTTPAGPATAATSDGSSWRVVSLAS